MNPTIRLSPASDLDDLLIYSLDRANPFASSFAPERELPYDAGVRQVARNLNRGWKDWHPKLEEWR